MENKAIESTWLIGSYNFIPDPDDSLNWNFFPENSSEVYCMTYEGYAWVLYKGRKEGKRNTYLPIQDFRYEHDFEEFWRLLFKDNVY